MSKHETWRTRKFWEKVGGLLIEEFEVVKADKNQARRLIDGIIVQNESARIHNGGDYDIKGKDIIIIQTKANRLGMYLLGQALFSSKLIQKFEPKSIRTVAICAKNDKVMEILAKDFGIEVVIIQ